MFGQWGREVDGFGTLGKIGDRGGPIRFAFGARGPGVLLRRQPLGNPGGCGGPLASAVASRALACAGLSTFLGRCLPVSGAFLPVPWPLGLCCVRVVEILGRRRWPQRTDVPQCGLWGREVHMVLGFSGRIDGLRGPIRLALTSGVLACAASATRGAMAVTAGDRLHLPWTPRLCRLPIASNVLDTCDGLRGLPCCLSDVWVNPGDLGYLSPLPWPAGAQACAILGFVDRLRQGTDFLCSGLWGLGLCWLKDSASICG